MRLIAVILITALIAGHALAEGAAINGEQVKELMEIPLQDKPLEELVRYFNHPNGYPASYLMSYIAEKYGKSASPLLEKLLKDENPWMRYGAVVTLGRIYMPKKPRGAKNEPIEVTPEIERLMDILTPLARDPHPGVSNAVASLSMELGVETEGTRRLAIDMAGSNELAVRQKALQIGASIIKDPDTQVKIGMLVSVFPDNIPRVWGHAHDLISRHKNEKVCRQALSTLANYLLNIGNTRPVRGMFSDGPQVRALETILAQWDKETEQMKYVVPGVCCAYVRVPHSLYPGWAKSRKLALEILHKMSPAAAPMIREYVASERKWLKDADSLLLKSLGENKRDGSKFTLLIDHLEYIADCLEKGEKIAKPCPIPLEEEKKFIETVPDVGEGDIEINLE